MTAAAAADAPFVQIYVITHRRPHLLPRALASIRAQTHANWRAEIINDDPDDPAPASLLAELGEPRFALFRPMQRRGPVENFNIAFGTPREGLVSVLEDDNWWEPGFLAEMVAALARHPDAMAAACNERVWIEQPDGSWREKGELVFGDRPTGPMLIAAQHLFGHLVWPNSAMLVRGDPTRSRRIPPVIMGSEEHYRARTISGPVVIVGPPLVNFAETLVTVRRNSPGGHAQFLLLGGSLFAVLPPGPARRELARLLWATEGRHTGPRAVNLVAVGVYMRGARALLAAAPARSLARFALWAGRHPLRALKLTRARARFPAEWRFLVEAPLTRDATARLVASLGSGVQRPATR